MGDNEQHNYGGNLTRGATTKTNGATVIPPQKKHVTTMMVQQTIKFVASTAKNMKNKSKINPEDHGS